MKDIARGLGVSVVTVSKVLRNHSDIGVETRKRVLQRMKELNYRPNPAARTLVTGRTNLIGLIVPDLVHPFFSQVAKAISVRLRSQGYSLVISSSEDDQKLEAREIDQMLGRRVDALILASTQSTGDNLRRIIQSNVPYVLLDRRVAGCPSNFVGIDDVKAGLMATNHLIEMGCKTIAHLGGSDVSTAVDRQTGYSMALARNRMTLGAQYIVKDGSGDSSGDTSGYKGMKQLLALKPRPDGVFCHNDPIAMGAIRAIFEAKLKIPKDIAVIGCGNVHYDDLLVVPLTSIDQDCDALGENSAKLALSLVNRNSESPKTQMKSVLSEVKLVVRSSTRR